MVDLTISLPSFVREKMLIFRTNNLNFIALRILQAKQQTTNNKQQINTGTYLKR
jgi:hypothetical protein